MEKYIILLRAINVAGKNIIKMAELKLALENNGFFKVQTYIQSGNIILQSEKSSEDIINSIYNIIENEFKLKSSVFLLTINELKQSLEKNPFKKEAGNFVFFTFMNDAPNVETVEKLSSKTTQSEEICWKEKVLYLYYPNGAGKSKLTNAKVESTLKISSTARNRNTIEKLLELL